MDTAASTVATSEAPTGPFLIRNRNACVIWCISAVIGLACVVASFVIVQSPVPTGWSPGLFHGLLILLWIGAGGFGAYALHTADVTVEISRAGDVSVTLRYPLNTDLRMFIASEVGIAVLEQSVDGDGRYYYRVQLSLPDKYVVTLAEGHRLDACEAVLVEFNTALASHVSSYGSPR